jgi:hypothetical protein
MLGSVAKVPGATAADVAASQDRLHFFLVVHLASVYAFIKIHSNSVRKMAEVAEGVAKDGLPPIAGTIL